MRINPDTAGCSIVLLGKFNPAIFHPAWMQAKDIEPNASNEDVEVAIVHPGIARFAMRGRMYHIEQERFLIAASSPPWVAISDATCKIFGEHLIHTPIHAFGVNKHMHFRLPSHQARVNLGRLLAPIGPWGEFGKQLGADDAGPAGGLQSLALRRPSAIEGAHVETNVTIEPSKQMHDLGAVYMRVNAHHAMTDLPEGYGAERAIETLSARFEGLVEEADAIIDHIMKIGAKQ